MGGIMKRSAKSILSILGALMSSVAWAADQAAAGAEPAAAAAKGAAQNSHGIGYWIHLFTNGGTFDWVILFVGVVVVILAAVKYVQLYMHEKVDAKNFYLKLKGYIKNEQFEEAAKVTVPFKETTIGFIFFNGMHNFLDAKKQGVKGRELQVVLQSAFDEASIQVLPRINSILMWFDILGQIATLLGLIGTIQGLIYTFDGLANAAESEKSTILTSGIYTAMATTFFGLCVGIPAQLIKGWFQQRADKLQDQIDEYSVKTINQISQTIKD